MRAAAKGLSCRGLAFCALPRLALEVFRSPPSPYQVGAHKDGWVAADANLPADGTGAVQGLAQRHSLLVHVAKRQGGVGVLVDQVPLHEDLKRGGGGGRGVEGSGWWNENEDKKSKNRVPCRAWLHRLSIEPCRAS